MELIDRLIGEIESTGSALLLSGEPGIGKSALLDVARHRAQERQISIIGMTGILAEVHLPFAALELALRPLMKKVERLPPRQQSALLAAFGVRDDATPPDIFLVGLATLSLLAESAARKPILIIADDVQWLDQETCEVLAFIARRLSSDPIILMAAIRDGFDRMFGGTDAVIRQRLSRLDNIDGERVLSAHAPDLAPEARNLVLEQAAGNPLALVELPRSARRFDADDVPWLPLTERLERAFSGRSSELPDVTQLLVLIAAENDGTSVRETLRAGEIILDRPVGLDSLTPAIAAKLIEIEGPELRFRHPLVRSALHQTADPATRQRIHATLAAVIEDHLDRRLWHRAAAAIGPDEELACEHDRMAARALRRGAVAMAVEVLEAAARLSGTAKARTDRLLRAAELAADLLKPDLLERLLRQADVDEEDELAAARIGWCREICQQPMVDDAAKISALIGLAEKARGAGAENLASNLLWRAAQRCWWSNGSTVRTSITSMAARLGLSDGNPALIAILAYTGPLANGADVHAKLQTILESGDFNPDAARILGSAANVIGAFDFGVTFFKGASAALRDEGRLSDLARVLLNQAWAEMEVGHWSAAMSDAEESIRFAEETEAPLWVAGATIVKAKIAGMQGAVEQAYAHAAEAERLVLAIGARFPLAMLQIARGLAALSAGRHSEAYEHLRRLFVPSDPAFNVGFQFFGLAEFVEAAVYSGNASVARSVLEEIEHLADPVPVPWVETVLCYSKALLAGPEEAERRFLDGLGPAAKHWPFLRGRLLLAYGAWLRRQRRSADARAPLREARDMFDALGASPWGERAREELRASGEQSHGRVEIRWEALTPQELHIAQLASDGLSNKEIGARLYLSHRTVGYHLHRIFSKTGITSRSGLRPLLAEGAAAGH